MAKQGLLDALAATVKAMRTDLGLSQEELAGKAELHRNYIGMIERGERVPTIAAIEGIAIGLNMKASELILRAEKRIR